MDVEVFLFPVLLFCFFIYIKQRVILPEFASLAVYMCISVYVMRIYPVYGLVAALIFILYDNIEKNGRMEGMNGMEGMEGMNGMEEEEEDKQEEGFFTEIPKTIYQTWHSRTLPQKMADCVERLKRDNPEFEHHLYDDTECRAFIAENFDRSVVEAYDVLIPGAFKADLWRYCVLYKKGGVYLDIKFQCEPGFSLKELTKDDETFILDRPYGDLSLPIDVNLALLNSPTFYDMLHEQTSNTWKNKQIGLYNAVMASSPDNPVLYECIQRVVKNVKKGYYGYNPLYPTGPGLLGEVYFKRNYHSKVKKIRYFNSIAGNSILSKRRKILSHYPEYRIEQRTYTAKGPQFYYHDLWQKKSVYTVIVKEKEQQLRKKVSNQ